MKFNRISLALGLMALCLGIVSCKKDKDDETVTYAAFSGDLGFEIPAYVRKGEVYRLSPTGDLARSADDGSEDSYGLVWTVDLRGASDTVRFEGEDASLNDGSMIFSIPDSLCDITLTLKAYASGYSAVSVSRSIMVIDPAEENGSLSGRDFPEGTMTFVDGRDGRAYRYRRIGGTDWMSENLAWDGAGRSFEESSVMDAIAGRFYRWEEAQSACPQGWRLPSNSDWLALAEAVTGTPFTDELGALDGLAGALMSPEAYVNQYRMWDYQPEFDIDNRSGLSMLPTGYATIMDGAWSFHGFTQYASFWTSDEHDARQGCYRLLHYNNPAVMSNYADKELFATSVRCVR